MDIKKYLNKETIKKYANKETIKRYLNPKTIKRHWFFFVIVCVCAVIVVSSLTSNLYIQYLNHEIDVMTQQSAELSEKIEEMTAQINTLEQETEELNKANNKLAKTQSKLAKKSKNLNKQLKSYNKQIKSAVKQINKINKKISDRTNWLIPKVNVGVCAKDSTFKTYMSYKAIQNHRSTQYRLLHSGRFKYCSDGLIRTKKGKYIAVALGSYYGSIGTKYICTLKTKTGNYEVRLIKVESKSRSSTGSAGCKSRNGDIIELVIDTKKAKKHYPHAMRMGNFNYSNLFNGKVVKMQRVTE